MIPLTIIVGNTTEKYKASEVSTLLAKEYGGATIYHGSGAWIDGLTICQDHVLMILIGIESNQKNEVIETIFELFPGEKAIAVIWNNRLMIVNR